MLRRCLQTWRKWRALPNRTAGAVGIMDLLSSEHPRLKIQALPHATKTAQPPAVTKAPAKAPPCGSEGPREAGADPKQTVHGSARRGEEGRRDFGRILWPGFLLSPPSPVRSRRRSRARSPRRQETRRTPAKSAR